MDRDNKKDAEKVQTEPTVWDWFVSFFRGQRIPIPDLEDEFISELEAELEEETDSLLIDSTEAEAVSSRAIGVISAVLNRKVLRFPVGIFFALFAQLILEQKPANTVFPIFCYLCSFILVTWAIVAGDFDFSQSKSENYEVEDSEVRISYLLFGAAFAVFTFFLTRGNSFNLLNLLTWGACLYFFLLAFWQGDSPIYRIRTWLRQKRQDGFNLRISTFGILFFLVILVSGLYRLALLDSVPTDMWSDQAEKLLDVLDILEGKFSIYFPNNTGREGLQMYMAAVTAAVFGTGMSYMTLKIGTALAGMATLPYIYLFGREFGGRYIGLLAMFLAGVAQWPNIISRLGLRFPLYPLFAAPALYWAAYKKQERFSLDGSFHRTGITRI
jgi:hypothetical protein